MKSLRKIYRIGMGPRRAAEPFAVRTPAAVRYRETSAGGLARWHKGAP